MRNLISVSLLFILFSTTSARAQSQFEEVPRGEEAAIREVESIIASQLSHEHRPGIVMRRDAHAKHHGCLKAQVTVEANLAQEWRTALYAPGTTRPAWIRYSNGGGQVKDDREGDGRGMAIKVLGVPGDKLLENDRNAETADLLMINHPVFFVENASDYIEFSRAIASGSPESFFFPGLNLLNWRVHEGRIANAIRSKSMSSLLHSQYWSMTPFLHGRMAVKYTARPCRSSSQHWGTAASPNYLRERLGVELASSGACFHIFAQKFVDEEETPIEDPTIDWDDSSPRLTKLATVTIPSQDFANPSRDEFCENISMTPWHNVPEHRPLGGINRARKAVYETISKLRHRTNSVLREEPTAAEFSVQP